MMHVATLLAIYSAGGALAACYLSAASLDTDVLHRDYMQGLLRRIRQRSGQLPATGRAKLWVQGCQLALKAHADEPCTRLTKE